ncbi:MAG: hypothetical protein IKO30_10020 [Lachnospiraceae bacterium]|nr:hypothetical protein [Lachnospiraceae bacterium]
MKPQKSSKKNKKKSLKKNFKTAIFAILTVGIVSALSVLAIYAFKSGTRATYSETGEARIREYLISELGFNSAAVCGIMSNISAESKFDENALNPNDSGGTFSYGVCQWNSGGRYYNLIDWSEKNGYSTGEMTAGGITVKTVPLQAQLEFMKYELENVVSAKYSELKKIENTAAGAEEAARIWAESYEICAERFRKKRIKDASGVYWPKYGAGTIERVMDFGKVDQQDLNS